MLRRFKAGQADSCFGTCFGARAVTPRYSLIIPAHNEEARITETLRSFALEFADSEIIVVLNGCTDGTESCVREVRLDHSNIQYVEIDHAVGKGGAVRAGFLVARSPLVGFVDADGSTPAVEMRRLFERLGNGDAVVASRWLPGSDVREAQPFKRRVASRVFNALVRMLFGLRLHDTQCGAKVFRADCLQQVMRNVETSNMAFDVDLLFALKRSGFEIREEPTVWNDRSGSRVRLVSASARMLSALFRLRLRYSMLRLIVPIFDRFFPTKPIRVHDGFSILIMNWRDPKHPQAGGAETYLFEMAKQWVAWGSRVEWLTAGFKGSAPQEVLDGVHVTRVGNAATVYLKAPWAYLSRFRDRFDVIVDAENGIPFFSPLFSLKPKLCLMFHVHKRVFLSQLPPPISWFFAWLETRFVPYLYRNSRFITISNTTRDEMMENKFSRHPIEVVHSGVDVNCIPGPKSETPVISYVGRLKRYKRIDDLVRAFVKVRTQQPLAKLVIAGSGDQEQPLRDLVADLHLEDSVEILGYVDDRRKVEILQRSWLFVTPSSMEGWGIAAIEANACGTPALAYDVPGLREAIADGSSGLIVPEGTDLAEPILRVLNDAALRAELCRGSIIRAAQFSWSATAERFLDAIMRNVAGDSFSMVRVADHWRVVEGARLQTGTPAEHVPLLFRQVEHV
jgi:glycosyltransferase involved in cell wall biosynthesis